MQLALPFRDVYFIDGSISKPHGQKNSYCRGFCYFKLKWWASRLEKVIPSVISSLTMFNIIVIWIRSKEVAVGFLKSEFNMEICSWSTIVPKGVPVNEVITGNNTVSEVSLKESSCWTLMIEIVHLMVNAANSFQITSSSMAKIQVMRAEISEWLRNSLLYSWIIEHGNMA